MKKYSFGWRPDKPDIRDLRYTPKGLRTTTYPTNVDLSSFFPPNYDQGELGSCTANGIAGAIQYCRSRERLADFIPSRLFIYYGERQIEGTIGSDAGAEIRDGIKFVASTGAPPEADWPYDESKFKDKPPQKAYDDAKLDIIKTYSRVDQTIDGICACVADAWPVVFGVTLYDSFQSDTVANTGLVPMPSQSESVVGGHCMVIVGYDTPRQLFQVRNSWSVSWGNKGNCWIPFDYLVNTDLASDFWQIDATTG